MKSSAVGKRTSAKRKAPDVEIMSVSPHGLWLWVLEHEYLLPFSDYPWFYKARVEDVMNVQLLHGQHLHWPALDIDLHIDSLSHPEHFPLKSKI